MTRSQLIKALAQAEGISLKRAELVVIVTIESITAAVENHGRVEIRGLGSFKVKHYQEYTARNPKNGELFEAKAKKLPVFRVGKELKERVDSGREGTDSTDDNYGPRSI